MVRLEFDPNPPGNRIWLVMGLAVLAAIALSSLIFWSYGVPPVTAYLTLFKGTLANPAGIAESFRRAIPLLLIGAGLSLAFRSQFFNIGAEGQLLLGASAATGVALFIPLPAELKLVTMFLAGFLAGGAYALIAALLKSRLGVNEILSTLMLNYIAVYIVQFLVNGPWKGRSLMGFAYTEQFPAAATLPVIGGTLIHWPTLLLGVLLALFLQLILNRSTIGYELRVVGENLEAARYAGINIGRTVLMVAMLSGGLAGLAGVGEAAGIHKRLLDPAQISLGYGFTAIIVAWLARGNPALTIFTALLMGLIFAGGDVMKLNLQMPFRVVDVFSGLLLMFLIGSEPLARYRLKFGRRA